MRDAIVDVTPADPGTRSAYLTYEPYYGLKEKAFSLSADPRFLYKSSAHAPTFDELRAGIRRREGIIVLTGEPGTGKTTLCRGVLAALDRKTFCAFVPDPFVSREDLLKMLLIEFGVLSVDDVRGGRLHAATRPELSYPLYDFLRSLVPLQAYAVLIIDEAQNLSSMLLEEIRILSDLEGPEKLLQLVLVGQPELRDKLKDPSMRQVDQRISVRCSLQPLGRDALPAYIAHRLTVAGAGDDRVEFTPEALDLLYGATNGNPRLLNLIADKSLHRGHLDRTWTITPEIVTSALGDLGYDTPDPAPDKRVVEGRVPVTQVVAPAPDLFLPEESFPEPSSPEITDGGPHFLLEEARGRDVSDEPEDTRGRRRRGALLVAVGVALGALVALNAWDPWRQGLVQQLQLPAVAVPPSLPVSAVVAPVIPPAEFFASVKP
jgi:type II secretory pathway predicted ATPase ExeA